MIARRLVIRGTVQGVGYRESMLDIAREHGVVGWVRNRYDGTVDAFVQGDADAVERVIAWCRRGPSTARVTAVEPNEENASPELTAFTRRRTE